MDIKVEKANAILRYKRLQKITALFRFMEVCIFLFIISRISTQLPFAFKLSGDFFRGLSITMFSPGFIFILGNAIVLILFFKSGQISSQESTSIDFCTEYVETCEKRTNINHTKQGKQVKQSKCEEKQGKEVLPDLCSSEDRKIRRSHSLDLKNEYSRRELRRSVTERSQKSVNSYAEDEMSGDEFRRKVEAFIARQQRSLREEEFSAIVTLGA